MLSGTTAGGPRPAAPMGPCGNRKLFLKSESYTVGFYSIGYVASEGVLELFLLYFSRQLYWGLMYTPIVSVQVSDF